ncbi:V-type ATP synthase subunit E [candidate division NPL-UPA2 bacterium Unc8]|uniref:V-type proton ATPase subunit E n=1 Tax=candidate division NPL-UPA2 bacterium Unc8 TaxID=1980939 RepID=A0A399FWA0_UNCN2|nr:V-type proton ATPase subunit E [Bacillota bacterium]MBT9138294.1 V-type proton ATPase subunit E [Bacillota bacterium]MBT9146767.1 V-type proton ATPase subunit E [Bacillota bacterium]RIH99775.1 MAG: V-type ATP synthase subunit E [candidate division NPL-UPA2 bacterium Unc8]
MAIEDILRKIRSDAEAKASEIIHNAKREEESILKKAKGEAIKLGEKLLKEGKDATTQERKREITMANLEARKEMLALKQELIEEAFKGTLNSLFSLPAEEYRSAIKKMLISAVVSGEEEVIIPVMDKEKLTSEFIVEVNEALKENGKKGNLMLSLEERNIQGGFILKDGRKETNLSFDSLIEEKRDELEESLISIIFDKKEA